MNISFPKVNELIKTLPIGYYAGRNIKMILSDNTDSSYYSPSEDLINISFKQIQYIAEYINSYDMTEESLLRTMLYHEVSHAILTPKSDRISFEYNVVEDERIETILHSYYKDVDFIKMKTAAISPSFDTFENAFLTYVRLHKLPQGFDKTYWLDRLNNIIYNAKNITAAIDVFNFYQYEQYEYDVRKLWCDFCTEFSTNKNKENSKNDENIANKENSNKNQSQLDSVESTNYEKLSNESLDFDKIKIKEKFKSILSRGYNKDYFDTLMKIFNSSKKIDKMNGNAINTYSGRFDPKSVIRDDYKYFVQQNRIGHKKVYSKIHLNLFIDKSGSFGRNDRIINQILFVLTKIEQTNSNFEYDMVACGRTTKLLEKNQRQQYSYGKNLLDETIIPIFKKLQKQDTFNINLVCFDGDAWSGAEKDKKFNLQSNASVFNTKNTVIISDYDNYSAFEKYCKNAKRIYTNDYVKELYKSIVNSLQFLLK